MDFLSKFAFPGILFILTLAFGFWVSSAGKPYNGILFNIHKLSALGGIVYAGWQFAQMPKIANSSTLLPVLLAVTALAVIAIFTSGGLLSAGKLDYALMLSIHRIAPVVLVVGLGLGMVLLKSSP